MTQAPQHELLEGTVAYAQAIDEVIGLAQRTLHVFDSDLAVGGFAGLARYLALRDFLQRDRGSRFVVVLHDVGYLTAHCPRLMQLLRVYAHAVSVFQTYEHARHASDALVIADGRHYVHRFHRDGRRFLLARHDPAGAGELEERFAQLQEASHPAAPATTLGL